MDKWNYPEYKWAPKDCRTGAIVLSIHFSLKVFFAASFNPGKILWSDIVIKFTFQLRTVDNFALEGLLHKTYFLSTVSVSVMEKKRA